jgi:hypothetical protein
MSDEVVVGYPVVDEVGRIEHADTCPTTVRAALRAEAPSSAHHPRRG